MSPDQIPAALRTVPLLTGTPPRPTETDEAAKRRRALRLARTLFVGPPDEVLMATADRLLQGDVPRTFGEVQIYLELAREGLLPKPRAGAA